MVAENRDNGRLMGSCFYHPREHHVSLGIMNAHPNYFGREAMKALELEVAGISREKDYRHCIRNQEGTWESLVFEEADGKVDGFMISCKHAALNMLGPCVTRTEGQAATLIARAADRYRGSYVLAAVPAHCADLVRQMYAWRARNCELLFCQVRGRFQPFRGVSMPTVMLETG